jgi:hypothetical protein
MQSDYQTADVQFRDEMDKRGRKKHFDYPMLQ